MVKKMLIVIPGFNCSKQDSLSFSHALSCFRQLKSTVTNLVNVNFTTMEMPIGAMKTERDEICRQ
ncbi:hypothetical protein CARUB_v10006464mg [Capsella rubella]|uniref:Uncharacterized protein n=1 Tax=Capsella rubella TaxID=81985 RepID=R0H3F2_9BRAS|nr:hypothetical protein CARUB_v10006464mg [Capsella rubella]